MAMPFVEAGLDAAMARAAQALGHATPTPIQLAAIGPIVAGRDVLAAAPTGSGKTAAFSLPLLQRLAAGAPRPLHGGLRLLPRALVLAPTRELAVQVGQVLRALAKAQRAGDPLRVAVAFGGVSINPQMISLRGGADVTVATPGRLLDLLAHNALALDAVQLLVLDEADRLIDLGFADELNRILALLPPARQNLLFSATFAPAMLPLAERLLRDPVRIDLTQPGDAEGPAASAPAIVQRAIAVDAPRRTQLLRHLLKENDWERVLVFVATQHAAQAVAGKLYASGIFAVPFHGDIAQGTRSDILAQFRQSRWDVVVATDLAARGLDIAQLPVVINYDLPRSTIDYTHRIGRTGRAGAGGLAISFVTPEREAHFRLIEKRQRISLPREQVAGFEPTPTPLAAGALAPAAAASDGSGAAAATTTTAAPTGTGGIKGKRPSKKDKLRGRL